MSTTSGGQVIGYARLSTADQAKGLTLEQQVTRLREAGATEVLVDLMTGTTTARPKYRELLRRIDAGEVSKVLATRWDRICRSATETCRMVDVFCAEGAPVLVLLDDPQDLSTIGGRAQLRMLGVFAQMEAERIRERSAVGKAHRASKGLIDVAPFGMQVVAGLLEPDRRPFLSELKTRREMTRADLLIEAFEAAAAGGSMHAPWIHLGHTYGVWLDRTGMRRLLLNPALRGARVGKRDKAKASWADVEEGAGGQPLIDPEEHRKFEAFIRGQMARRNAPDKRRSHVLAGKVICGHCNRLMGRGIVSGSGAGRWFCRNQECPWLIPRKRRNATMEAPLLAAVLEGMAGQAREVADAMERQARQRDQAAQESPEVERLQAKRRQYLALLADGDPVQPVIDQLDRDIAAMVAAGQTGSGGGHLLELRDAALRRARVTGVLASGGEAQQLGPGGPAMVAEVLGKAWQLQSSWAGSSGEEGIGPGVATEIRELVRSAVVLERRLVGLDLNI